MRYHPPRKATDEEILAFIGAEQMTKAQVAKKFGYKTTGAAKRLGELVDLGKLTRIRTKWDLRTVLYRKPVIQK